MDADRFAKLSSEQKTKILEDVNSDNTKKSTVTAVNVLREYLACRHLSADFVNLPKEELNQLLSDFYLEARNKKGERFVKFI